jgi:phenylalanyl-tRNA synthetase beta chain
MFADADAVPVANPLRAEEGWLRTRLTPGLLRAVARNRALGVDRVALFEVGTTFRLADPFTEHRKLGFVLAGSAEPGWAGPRRSFDVWDATGIIERLFAGLRVEHWSWGGPPAGPFHPGRAATVMVGDRHAGVVGEIHPRVATALDLEGRVSVGVLGLGPLYDAVGAFAFRDVPRFPPLLRDLAFIVPEDTQAGTVRALLVTAAGPLLDSIELFDVYSGDAVPTGAKSLAFRVGLRAEDRTLSDTDAEPVFAAMVEAVATGAGGELRAGGPGSRPPGAPD